MAINDAKEDNVIDELINLKKEATDAQALALDFMIWLSFVLGLAVGIILYKGALM